MNKIGFFIERRGGAYVLVDAKGDLHLGERFPDRAAAADMAVRFAQGLGALYSIHY